MLLFSTILDINETLTKDDFIRLVIDWNQSSTHETNIIHDIKWNGERNIRFGNDDLWLAVEEYRNRNIIAVRFEKREENGAIWDTDYVMNFNSMKMAIRLDRSYSEDALKMDQKFSTPLFISFLIERGYLKDDNGLPVQRVPVEIDENNTNVVTDVINGKKEYTLPIVYISNTVDDEHPVNIFLLASRLKGVAHIMAQKSRSTNKIIREQCDDRNEYFGGIGIYYPLSNGTHSRYVYRKATGYDSFLLEKICREVIQYSCSKKIDTLLTWTGVNSALLIDRLNTQRDERLIAEEARKAAEEKYEKLNDTLDEKEREFQKKAKDEAKFETDMILDSFEEDLQKLKDQLQELTRENERLKTENQGLKIKLESRDSVPLLFMGEEFEFYPGEVKDLILDELSLSLKDIKSDSRRAHIISDIIESNDFQRLTQQKVEELKRILKNYDGMSSKTRQVLKDLGFEITEDGKHYKLTYYGDERYQLSYSKTPSDFRTGKNTIQKTVSLVF